MTRNSRRVVFFDLDGTLHQQDLFGAFIRYLLRRLPLNALLVLPLLPVTTLASHPASPPKIIQPKIPITLFSFIIKYENSTLVYFKKI